MPMKVLPPSSDFAARVFATKMTLSLVGSTRMLLKYIGRPLQLLTSVHVRPLFSERYSPGRWLLSAGGVRVVSTGAAFGAPPAPPPNPRPGPPLLHQSYPPRPPPPPAGAPSAAGGAALGAGASAPSY